MNEGMQRLVAIITRLTGSAPPALVVAQGVHVESYRVYSGLSEILVVRKSKGPDEFFHLLDDYLVGASSYDVLDEKVVAAFETICARMKAAKEEAERNLPARRIFWALYHLHRAGSDLTSRQHEYIDSIEYELCALVRSRPEDCKECERRTPNALLKEAGAEGRCPVCRGEEPPQ